MAYTYVCLEYRFSMVHTILFLWYNCFEISFYLSMFVLKGKKYRYLIFIHLYIGMNFFIKKNLARKFAEVIIHTCFNSFLKFSYRILVPY